jgi:hypothetical protein
MLAAENWRASARTFDASEMRRCLAAAALALAAGCATRAQPYRFASPLLGAADVPAHAWPDQRATSEPDAPRTRPPRPVIANRRGQSRRVGGWQADSQQGAIRTVSARGIETTMPVASAEVASAIRSEPYAREVVWSRLPAPHLDSPGGAAIQLPGVREPADLRARVGQRDRREPFAIVMDWLGELGVHVDVWASEGPALVVWAQGKGMLAPPTEPARPGEILEFDRVTSDGSADLVALVIGRDARGVTEFMYAGGGVIRRGFLDPTRARTRRDIDGAVVNTFLRHGKRYPPKGTRYLAGELLSHVIHVR